MEQSRKIGRTINIAIVDSFDDNLGSLAVNLAPNAVGSAQDLLNSTLEFLGKRLVSHCTGDFDNLIKADRLIVLDVLLLLTITRRLLEGPDDQRRSGRNNGHRSLTILNGKLDSYAQAFLISGLAIRPYRGIVP